MSDPEPDDDCEWNPEPQEGEFSFTLEFPPATRQPGSVEEFIVWLDKEIEKLVKEKG